MGTEPNGDSIKPVAAGLPRKTLNVRPAGAPETTTLGGIDLFETLTPGTCPGRLDLYEDQQISLAGHEIKLRAGDPNIACKDIQALASQVAGGFSLTQAAQGGTVYPAGTSQQPAYPGWNPHPLPPPRRKPLAGAESGGISVYASSRFG